MKFCKDCKHFVPANVGLDDREYAKCALTAEVAQNPVTGVETTSMKYCDMYRNSITDYCGPEGSKWEAK